jgi:hypothetical protein
VGDAAEDCAGQDGAIISRVRLPKRAGRDAGAPRLESIHFDRIPGSMIAIGRVKFCYNYCDSAW